MLRAVRYDWLLYGGKYGNMTCRIVPIADTQGLTNNIYVRSVNHGIATFPDLNVPAGLQHCAAFFPS